MRREIQIKTRHLLTPEELIAMGAEWVGNVDSENFYLGNSTDEMVCRIRIEDNVYHYSEKGNDVGQFARVKDIEERQISANEAQGLIRRNGIIEKVESTSHIFVINGALISLDEVIGLGSFMEVRTYSDEAELIKTLERLGIKKDECIKESYYDLMRAANISKWRRPIVRMHKRITEMVYGFTSGIMTSCGMLIGVYFAMPTKLAVASSMMALAVSDSLSEAYAMYNAKLTEGLSQRNALRHGLYTMNGNFIIPAIFLIPIFLFRLKYAVALNLALSATILITFTAFDAIATQNPITRRAGKTLGLAIIIVTLSTIAGKLVATIFS